MNDLARLTNVQQGATTITAGANYGTSFTTGAINTKGAYAEIIAATSGVTHWVTLYYQGASVGFSGTLDLALGAAGSETIILPDFFLREGTIQDGAPVTLPLQCASGVRLAHRAQATLAAQTGTIAYNLWSGGAGVATLQQATTYGSNTSLDAGGSANTKGSYTELTAATTHPVKWLVVQLVWSVNLAGYVNLFAMDLAVGAAGAETILVPDLCQLTFSASGPSAVGCAPYYYSFPLRIPSGVRLAARCKHQSTNASGRVMACSLLALN